MSGLEIVSSAIWYRVQPSNVELERGRLHEFGTRHEARQLRSSGVARLHHGRSKRWLDIMQGRLPVIDGEGRRSFSKPAADRGEAHAARKSDHFRRITSN